VLMALLSVHSFFIRAFVAVVCELLNHSHRGNGKLKIENLLMANGQRLTANSPSKNKGKTQPKRQLMVCVNG